MYLDVDATILRLTEFGLDAGVRQVTVSGGVRMAVVRDPNGVLVELIDAAAVRGNPELASSGGS